jgi:hypothetical protein
MFDFLRPEYLGIAAALISVPIIIHLINRLRFKRLRWAAMEFLLKAQKRNRRRLIIEQLMLLALRCFLVALVGIMVMRFVGLSFGGFNNRQSLHVVILDDTLSLNDQWKEGDGLKDSFQVARNEILLDKIAKGMRQSGTTDKLIVLPLTKVNDPGFAYKIFDRLHDHGLFEEMDAEVKQLTPSLLHVDLLHGVKKAKEIAQGNPESQLTLHILSDFRQKDWGQAEGEALHKELVDFAKQYKAKIRLVDTAHPYRTTGQSGVPLAHDNIGIVDLRPGTRIVGKDMPVTFTINLANYSSREADVNVSILDDSTGKEMLQVDFNPPLPLKIPAGSVIQASFDLRFSPQLKAGETYFAQISAHLESALRGKLENDGLLQDNIRYAAVEVRDQVPVLVLDGEGKGGREEERLGKDSFYLPTALVSVPGSSYRVDFGDMLGGSGGIAAKALERPDLRNYPTIFLLNMRDLTPKQLANLETYAREGGGVAFFLGPQVSVPYYNKQLYKDGQGIFPAPLREPYFPPPNEEMLQPEITGAPMLLLRDDLFPSQSSYPIFGAVFKDPEHRDVLTDLPIKRYFKVAQTPWRSGNSKVAELATLPNDFPATKFQETVVRELEPELEKILEQTEYAEYRKGLERHRANIKNLVRPTSEQKAVDLAVALDEMLMDKGKEKEPALFPNITEFWEDSDPKVQSLKKRVIDLRDQVRYGDPFVLTSTFGKGKVVAVMTTAGKGWNEWGGGRRATTIYTPFIWEMQNFLSSQSQEANLMVGTPVEIAVDSEPYKQNNRRLKLDRTFLKAGVGRDVEKIKESEQFGVEKQGILHFDLEKNMEPGLYVAHLLYDDSPDKKLASWGHVFNVDTVREGPLQRVSYDDLKGNVLDKAEGLVHFEGTNVLSDELVTRRSDLSESPLFFLLFLAVLVTEQALAVHLSFHLKGSEGETLSQITQTRHAA